MYYEGVEAQLLKKQDEAEEIPFTPSTISRRKSSFVIPAEKPRQSVLPPASLSKRTSIVSRSLVAPAPLVPVFNNSKKPLQPKIKEEDPKYLELKNEISRALTAVGLE